MSPFDDLMQPVNPEERRQRKHQAPDYTMSTFVRHTFAHWLTRRTRYSVLFKRDGVAVDVLAEMRRKYNEYTGRVLQELSDDIGAPDKYHEKQVLIRLALHMACDISLNTPALCHHLEGFVVTAEASGGFGKLLADGDLVLNYVVLHMIIVTVGNTTAPSHDHVRAESYYSNEDVYMYYGSAYFEEFPCPTYLFFSLRDINRLRRTIARGECGGTDRGPKPL
ncbi:hypothetical protein NLG97_g6041 [Lecanicillium saksenae]|uniref:Uncharacterized protein n=1 Tax=Lecanicillium saksenae TaxID=468837 RepID=A0ACC1QRX6_9HYPO|nr:hypothetical protein NLG97_g6041 [Lecanicillium saksenae]